MENIKDLLKSLDVTEEDYMELLQICPGLEIADNDKMMACVDVVVKYGYPKEDLDSLILINPSFLMWEPKDLENRIKHIMLICDNLEDKLKEDPYII